MSLLPLANTTRLILDTSFLIDIQNSVDAATEKAREIESKGRPRRVPHVVLYELYIGVGKGVQSDENRERIESVVSSLPLEPTTSSIARRAGKIEGGVAGRWRGNRCC